MLNQVILLKVKQRLNKLDSSDYDNIENWQVIEAFNKAQSDWCRRNLHGLNAVKEGDEQSNRRIDDMQIMLRTVTPVGVVKPLYYEIPLPDDYLQWKRVSAYAVNSCCPNPRRLTIYLAEEGNVDILLNDKNKRPSFDWAETFVTMKDNAICIYTNDEFQIVKPSLTYYRQPIKIQIAGIVDPYTGVAPTVDVNSEFKDDLVELFIDETVKILGGDIESFNQAQREGQAVESNN